MTLLLGSSSPTLTSEGTHDPLDLTPRTRLWAKITHSKSGVAIATLESWHP